MRIPGFGDGAPGSVPEDTVFRSCCEGLPDLPGEGKTDPAAEMAGDRPGIQAAEGVMSSEEPEGRTGALCRIRRSSRILLSEQKQSEVL